jgi:hypothetical protein
MVVATGAIGCVGKSNVGTGSATAAEWVATAVDGTCAATGWPGAKDVTFAAGWDDFASTVLAVGLRIGSRVRSPGLGKRVLTGWGATAG